MELKVALCQFDMVWEDKAANLRTAGRMVAEADADLVILQMCIRDRVFYYGHTTAIHRRK